MSNYATQLDEPQFNVEKAWQQLTARDPKASFLYGVATTGVFCRPGCPSRLPLRTNTHFFATPAEATAAGFRPCQRCKPEAVAKASPVTLMCTYIERKIANQSERPVALSDLGKLTGMSPFTAQRLFKQAMGATPAQYQRALRANALRSQLQRAPTVTAAIYEAGYGASSRVYEATPLGMTPGRFANGGRGERIGFVVSDTGATGSINGASGGFGSVIVASTSRGVCWVALGDSPEELESGLRAEFPAASIAADPELASTMEAVLMRINHSEAKSHASRNLPLDLRGTAFQLRVWSALQQIPPGETRTYSQLAREMGNPAATRAVARACATNRVAVLVPCHRVVGASGSLTGYRWGVDRKRQLLAAEHE